MNNNDLETVIYIIISKMNVDEQQRLRTDAGFNYYIISAFRPGARLFAVRTEWEIATPTDPDQDSEEDSEEDSEDSDYHIAAIQFGGLPHLVVGLPRTTHEQVTSICEELQLRIVPGHPMTSDKEHFPLEAAQDSVFTLESLPNTVTKQNLQELRCQEGLKVTEYLQSRFRDDDDNLDESRAQHPTEHADPDAGDDSGEESVEVKLLP